MEKRGSTGERRREGLGVVGGVTEVLAADLAELVLGEDRQRILAVRATQSRAAQAAQLVIDSSPAVHGTGGRPPSVAAKGARMPKARFAAANVPVGGGAVGEGEL